MATEILKAFKFALDPTDTQVVSLSRHAGAARWAYNHALASKVAAHEEWRRQVATLVNSGTPDVEARKNVRVPVPSKPVIQKALNAAKGDSRTGVEGLCPWWHEVNTYAFQSAFVDADHAWHNWLDSHAGRRGSRQVGHPRFKKKGRCRESFRLHHNVKKPGIRLPTYRRLRLPKIGDVRLHESAKRLGRLIAHGYAQVQSVTVTRAGHRWYASVLCKVLVDLPDGPTERQRTRGAVGVDLGVKYLAALSEPLQSDASSTTFVPNPRHLKAAEKRLAKAQRALSRAALGSARREKAKRRLGRLHHEVAVRRDAALHQVTKRLASEFAVVAVEDLAVTGMSASARGSVGQPGRRVRQKAGLNRSIRDAALAEFRRQLTYKTLWYGSRLAVLDRWFPSSKTCSACGWRNPSLTLAERLFNCDSCGMTMDRDLNAAKNIARHAIPIDDHVARDEQETENARGVPVRPASRKGRRQGTSKREDTAPGVVPPRRSNPSASPRE